MEKQSKNNINNKIIDIPQYSVCIVGLLSFILIGIICFLFGWKRTWDTNLKIDHEVWGTLGDFIGGLLGTVFALLSVYLMYLTFKAQRILTENSDKKQERIAQKTNEAQTALAIQTNTFQQELSKLSINQAETQRFNDLFFELLHRYQDLSQELTDIHNKKNNDDKVFINYFDSAMETMTSKFPYIDNYRFAVLKAERNYTEYYLDNAKLLAPIFRTLYRIMELIDSSEISTKEKLRYAKIIRAQLRESELFFLRYNCMTFYGKKFIEYINSYRLIKHLPIMSLLEFKYLKEKYGEDNQTSLTLNMIFRNAWRTIYRITVGKEDRGSDVVIFPSSAKYRLSVDMQLPQKTVLTLSIEKKRINKTPVLNSLSKLTDDDLQLLLKNFLKEVYKYSNFRQFNEGKDRVLRIDSSMDVTTSTKYIRASIKSNVPLRLSHPKWDQEYGLSVT